MIPAEIKKQLNNDINESKLQIRSDIERYLYPFTNCVYFNEEKKSLSINSNRYLGEKDNQSLFKELIDRKEVVQALFISLNSCGLGQIGAINLGKTLCQMETILELDLVIKRDFINESGVEQLYQGLTFLKKVQSINLQVEQPYSLLFIALLNSNASIKKSSLNLKYFKSISFEQHSDIKGSLLKQLSLELELANLQVEGAKGLGKSLYICQNLLDLSLTLTQNNISEQGIIELCFGIKHLTQLERLKIIISQKNYIGNKGFIYLLESIKQLNQLRELSLSVHDKTITGQAINLIGFQLRDLEYFEDFTLKIFVQNISRCMIWEIHQGLKELQKLKRINLLVLHDYSILFLSLFKYLPSLEDLQIGGINKIQVDFYSDTNIQPQQTKQVSSINFELTDIGEDTLIGFEEILADLTDLVEIKLETSNKEYDKQIIHRLYTLIHNRHKIKKLSISTDYYGICHGYEKIIQLEEFQLCVKGFDISQNQIIYYICDSISQLTNLKRLTLKIESNNSTIQQFDSSFSQLIKLTYLELSLNQVHQGQISYLSKVFKYLPNVETIKLKMPTFNSDLIKTFQKFNNLKFFSFIINQKIIYKSQFRDMFKTKRLVLFS